MFRPLRNSSMALLFSLIVFLLLPLPCPAADILNLPRAARFSSNLNPSEAVRNECQLETKVMEFIESSARDDFDKVEIIDSAGSTIPGKMLSVTITDLSAASGGVWSGPKHLTIEGALWQDGKMIGTFTARRVAGSGAFGAYKGTCNLLGRCARALGKDVAGWLRDPSMGAVLGDEE